MATKEYRVTTRYLGPTNTRGSRIMMRVQGGPQKTVPFPYESTNPHLDAVKAWLGTVHAMVRKTTTTGYVITAWVVDPTPDAPQAPEAPVWQAIDPGTALPVAVGDDVADFRGEVWRFEGVSQSPQGSSSGRVNVSRPCPDCGHYWHRDGRESRELYPSVFDLTLVKVED